MGDFFVKIEQYLETRESVKSALSAFLNMSIFEKILVMPEVKERSSILLVRIRAKK